MWKILLVVSILFIVYLLVKYNSYKRYYCAIDIPEVHRQAYERHGYYSNYLGLPGSDIFIPSQLDNAEKEYDKNNNRNINFKYVNGIYNMNAICSKRNLYLNLQKYYKQSEINMILPKTFPTNDISTFEKSFNLNKIYILKKDIQRQEGLHLTNNLEEIKKLSKDYVVVQEFLDKPFIINDHLPDGNIVGRKINLRIYMFVIIKKGIMSVYIYKDGFIYYTPLAFKYCLEAKRMITSGYIERDVYARNPLTLGDLKIYVNKLGYNYDTFWNRLKDKILILTRYYTEIWKVNNINTVYYQIFGVDVEPDSTFTDLKILEVNKGPDLGAKDGRDGELKQKMFNESLDILFDEYNKSDESSNFEKIF